MLSNGCVCFTSVFLFVANNIQEYGIKKEVEMLIVEDQFQEEAVDNIPGKPFHMVRPKTRRGRPCKDLRMLRRTERNQSHEEIQENKKAIHRFAGNNKIV